MQQLETSKARSIWRWAVCYKTRNIHLKAFPDLLASKNTHCPERVSWKDPTL